VSVGHPCVDRRSCGGYFSLVSHVLERYGPIDDFGWHLGQRYGLGQPVTREQSMNPGNPIIRSVREGFCSARAGHNWPTVR
jgi:hypothetical protein